MDSWPGGWTQAVRDSKQITTRLSCNPSYASATQRLAGHSTWPAADIFPQPAIDHSFRLFYALDKDALIYLRLLLALTFEVKE